MADSVLRWHRVILAFLAGRTIDASTRIQLVKLKLALFERVVFFISPSTLQFFVAGIIGIGLCFSVHPLPADPIFVSIAASIIGILYLLLVSLEKLAHTVREDSASTRSPLCDSLAPSVGLTSRAISPADRPPRRVFTPQFSGVRTALI